MVITTTIILAGELCKLSLTFLSRFGGYLLAGLSRKFIEVGNIKYSYFEWKPPPTQSAPVTVLFIHGFSGCKTMWMVMAKYLPKEWHLVMLDMPGHGETSFNLNDDYSSTGLATKLNQVSSGYLHCRSSQSL